MNNAHLHLLTNHLPILLPIVGLVLLIAGLILKSDIIKRASYCTFIVAAISAIFTLSSGESAEEVLEGMQIAEESFIKEHEEIAEVFAVSLYILGALSVLGLWANWNRKWYSPFILFSVIILSLVTLYYGKLTGTSGGEIRHTEIRDTEACVTPFNTPSLDSTCVPSNLNGDSQFQEQRFSHLNQVPINLSFSYFVL
jgi:uncharacterized membrane protein